MKDTTRTTKTHFVRIISETDNHRAVLRWPRDSRNTTEKRSIHVEQKSLDAMAQPRWTCVATYEEICIDDSENQAIFDLLANGENPNDPGVALDVGPTE